MEWSEMNFLQGLLLGLFFCSWACYTSGLCADAAAGDCSSREHREEKSWQHNLVVLGVI